MKNEALQKLSSLFLHGTLLCFIAVMFFVGVTFTLTQHALAGPVLVCGLALVIILGSFKFFSGGYYLSRAGVVISHAFGSSRILYRSVVRVDHVRREGSATTEKVRITFRRCHDDRIVELTPSNPEALVMDILNRCPQLTAVRSHKIIRDLSFRVIKEPLPEARSATVPPPAPVPY